MRWPSIRSTNAGSISALPADKSTCRRMRANTGRRLSTIFRQYCRWKCKRSNDSGVVPGHLRTLARVNAEVTLEISGAVTQRSVLDALEAKYPMLQGTIRDHVTGKRRDFLRFFACQEDLSHESPDAPLPEAVASGAEPFLVIGAIAGG